MKLKKDPITVTLKARDMYDAEVATWVFEENVEPLPKHLRGTDWLKTISKFPVELYFLFPNKRKYIKYMKALQNEKTAIKIIGCY